jgi:plasmid maintenance system antidote protein VapI
VTIDIKWFQDRIRDLGTSQRKLSTEIATNPNTISMILNGNRKLTHDEIPVFARILETTTDEVLRRLGVDMPAAQKARAIEVVGRVDETGKVADGGARRTVEAPANATGNTQAIIMDALGGEHTQHGWVYYFDQPAKPRPVDADSINSLCVVEIGDKPGYYLAVVRRSLERGVYDLVNAFTGERIVGSVVIRSASPVTWIKTA